ncbi:MAG TPA: hypothetical protein VF209_04565 [Patescibacteria group bacterium]
MTVAKATIANLRQKQSLLYLLLFSLATVMIWVVISLITSQQRPGISPELQQLAQPLTPTLNQDTLQKIESKQFYSESELSQFPIYKIITAPNGVDELVVTIDTDEASVFPPRETQAPSPSPTPEESPAQFDTPAASQSATSTATESAEAVQ